MKPWLNVAFLIIAFGFLSLSAHSPLANESRVTNDDEPMSSVLKGWLFRGASSQGQTRYLEQAATHPHAWPKTLSPVSEVMPDYRRTIIHIHSVFSHDACDGKPRLGPGVEGANEPCFQDLEKSFCELNTDIVFVTEHSKHMSEFPFEDVWHTQPGDTPIMENGTRVGTVRTCADGHQVHMYLGAENKLMPIGLTRHPEALTGLDLYDTYEARTPEVVQKFRDAGALVGVAHSEDPLKPTDYIKSLGADFMEIYNTHAEFLILLSQRNYFTILDRLLNLVAFSVDPLLEPDLFYLSLQTENQAALLKWSQVALSQHITGTAGTDVHQNLTPNKMFDGERYDSYRRLQRWFSNYVYAPDPSDRQGILRSIKDGRNLVVFEVYGMPQGFEFTASTNQGVSQMGDTVTRTGKFTVRMQMPKLIFNDQENHEAELEGMILKATPEGWRTVAQGKAAALEYQSDEPGVFRSQVLVRPNHLMRYIPGMFHLDGKHVWVYSNPIWIN